MDGLQAASLIKRTQPGCRIIMLTSFTDTVTVKRALAAGVEGYCSKQINPARLLHVIEMVATGSICLDPAIADFVLRHYFTEHDLSPLSLEDELGRQGSSSSLDLPLRGQQTQFAPFSGSISGASDSIAKSFIPHADKSEPATGHVLKGRELEILALVANGHDQDEIARILTISIDWVNGYIKGILQKLAVNTEWEAVKKALADGALRKIAPPHESGMTPIF